jgi:predicted ATP-dependent endonuclease of OLD family
MIFAFGYKLGMSGIELDDAVQGSGIQSLLMLETLYLIDRDYFQKFGWKQAAIWAIEEPESSLHTSLEALVAYYLSSISSNSTSRLQVLSTTHSDLMLQYADKIVSVKKENLETTCKSFGSASEAINRLSREGISRWSHPLLHYPLEPLILVEGKYDATFLEEAFRILKVPKPPRVSYIERLENDQATGGVDELYNYVKNNSKVIKSRQTIAPVIVILDWDASGKRDKFSKLLDDSDRFKILVWPDNALNPKLGKSFKGIERSFSNRMIEAVENKGAQIFRSKSGVCSVERDQYEQIKKQLNQIVIGGLIEDDIEHAKPFIQNIIDLCPK